uniref:S100 calcium binding protein A11 n=1 Tax=Junco hyemalis TaxID=40217 RepID=A0A8C5IUS8_JUNHY
RAAGRGAEAERSDPAAAALLPAHHGNSPPHSRHKFPVFFRLSQNQKDPGVVDRMMKKLDMNSDGQLDFQEFLNLIGGIAVACHDSLVLKAPKP